MYLVPMSIMEIASLPTTDYIFGGMYQNCIAIEDPFEVNELINKPTRFNHSLIFVYEVL